MSSYAWNHLSCNTTQKKETYDPLNSQINSSKTILFHRNEEEIGLGQLIKIINGNRILVIEETLLRTNLRKHC